MLRKIGTSNLKLLNTAKPIILTSQRGISILDKAGEPRFLENVKMFLKRAASNVDIPQDWYTYIEACKSFVRFNVPLRMDDGTLRTISCYRA